MHRTPVRLAAWSLVVGTVVATAGYASAFFGNGNGLERFAGSSWTTLYTVALFGDVLVILGLPALIHAQGERSRTLTLIGYAGAFVPMVILNVGEGSVEAFVKPYFATHGGLLESDLPGLMVFEAPALLAMIVGMICLGIAIFRARALPRWIGVAFIIVPFLGAAGDRLPGQTSLIPDYILFIGLFAVGLHTLRARGETTSSTTTLPAKATV